MKPTFRILTDEQRRAIAGGAFELLDRVGVKLTEPEARALLRGAGARVESEPYRDHPRWNRERIYDTVIKLFQKKALTSEGLLSHIVRFENVVEAYRALDEKPEEIIKLGVTYS